MANTISCSRCKGKWDCLGKEYYSPGDIKFCVPQIQWVLANGELLNSGSWVTESSSAVDMPRVQKGGRKTAKFINPLEVFAEVSRRLEWCGLDGLLVYLFYGYSLDEFLLGKYYRLQPQEVRHRIEAVMWFCSGFNFFPRPYRRWHIYRDFENWKSQREVKVG